jgi:hypothetical protein
MRNSALTIAALLALGVGSVPAANAVTISLLPKQGTIQVVGKLSGGSQGSLRRHACQ